MANTGEQVKKKKPKWRVSLKYSTKEILYALAIAQKSDKFDIWYVRLW